MLGLKPGNKLLAEIPINKSKWTLSASLSAFRVPDILCPTLNSPSKRQGCILYIYVSYNLMAKIIKQESRNVTETAAKSRTLMKKVDIILLRIKHQIPYEHSPERRGQGASGLAFLVVSCYPLLCFFLSQI